LKRSQRSRLRLRSKEERNERPRILQKLLIQTERNADVWLKFMTL